MCSSIEWRGAYENDTIVRSFSQGHISRMIDWTDLKDIPTQSYYCSI